MNILKANDILTSSDEKLMLNTMIQKSELDEDIILMENLKQGCQDSLRILVHKWKNPLINFFYKSLGDVHTSQDLAQQTFINLYKAKDKYQVKSKFSTYIFSIARNILINEYRRLKRKPLDSVDPADMNYIQENHDKHFSDLEEIFYKTLRLLPEKQRTAILLLKQQELSYDEIAKLMNEPVSSVKTWLHRARQTLRKALKEFDQ